VAVSGIVASLSDLGNDMKLIVCGQTVADSNQNSQFFDKVTNSGAQVSVIQRRKESIYGAFLRFNELKSIYRDIAEADIVILHQVYQLQYCSIAPILLMMKKPYVVMPHGTLTTYQRNQHKFRKFVFAPFTYMLLKFSKAIFVATEQENSQLPQYLKEMGINVGLGVELPLQKFQGKIHSTPVFKILYMGRITKKKRLDIALQAFALAAKKSKIQMRFIVCGSGEEAELAEVKKLVGTLQIENDVDFRGWVDFSEKHSALAESDCFILTSEDENFAIAAAEALAHGIPCILSANVALASLVTKYSAGIVFQELNPIEIEEAIIKISLTDRELSRHSSLLAASKLNWDVIGPKWELTLKALLRV
jgi:glycosyltransferase involved in cell wall biosynthesis